MINNTSEAIADYSDIANKILSIRGTQVILDKDLAVLYGVENRALKQAVRRNLEKFPDDFMFRLSISETNELILSGVSQFVIPSGYNAGGADVFSFTANPGYVQKVIPMTENGEILVITITFLPYLAAN